MLEAFSTAIIYQTMFSLQRKFSIQCDSSTYNTASVVSIKSGCDIYSYYYSLIHLKLTLPSSGLEDVTGIVSATMLRNTVSDSNIVTPGNISNFNNTFIKSLFEQYNFPRLTNHNY